MRSSVDNHKNECRQSDYKADALLVARASAGNKEALAELCGSIAKGVLYRVKYSLNSYSDAEDVSQEVLLQVCKRIHELRSPEAFRVWLGRIIIGETNRFLKKRIMSQDILNINDYIDAIVEDREEFLPAEFAENADARKAVLDAISKLPARQRQVVLFYYYDGLSINDIAEAMNLAQSSVSTHLVRARESIKLQIQKGTDTGNGAVAKMQSMSLGFILFDVLKEDAASFVISNSSWLQNALTHCSAAIAAGTAATFVNTTAKTSISLILSKCAVVFVLGAVSCGLLMIDNKPALKPAIQWVESAAMGEGKIIFSGGELYRGTNRVNPLSAHPELEEKRDTIVVNEWWITPRENDNEVLFRGYKSGIDLSLTELRDTCQYGEYMLRFLLECESGAVYRMSSNFYIKELPDSP